VGVIVSNGKPNWRIFEEYDLTKMIYATKKIVEDINYRTFEFASKQVFLTHKLDFHHSIDIQTDKML
jgi:hypothetical protein